MPGHWGGSSSSSGPGPGGQGARGQATQGGGGGGGPPGQGGGGQAAQRQRAAEQAAAQRAVQQAAVDKAAIDKAATERALQTIISGKEKQQAESERMSNLAEARRKMTQPVTINLPGVRTIQPLGTIDPYQQSHVSPNMILTTGIYESPNEKPITTGPGMAAGPMGYLQQGYQPPVPAGTGEGLGSIDVGFQNALRKQQIRKDDIARQQDPNYGQFFKPKSVVEKPKFFDTGMGKLVKGAGAAMALPLASAFLPKQAVTALTWGKRIKDIKDRKGIYGKALGFMEDKTGKKFGFNNLTSTMDKAKAAKFRDERTTLGKQDIEDWERKQDWSGIKPDVGGGGDGQGGTQAQVPKDVVTASIQKFSPEQADMMKQKYSQLQGVIDSGVYQGRQLTPEEIQMLQQKSLDIQKLMEQYLVDPEELGLARGGIASIYG